ncbi:MAG: MotA/TolQ/ExbB proton channel family protein [Rubricella sp.]
MIEPTESESASVLLEIVLRGGPAMAVLAGLSVLTLAVILWRLWVFSSAGIWSGEAATRFADRHADASEDVLRQAANAELADAAAGLRLLELVAVIAPLIGLLGTVLGMIDAFQALEAAGNRADPGVLAGGIWEALLTTAAGMTVAIPALAAQTWFEGVVERYRLALEAAGARIMVDGGPR